MAFDMWFSTAGDANCDKCKKASSVDRPILHLIQSGRRWDEKNVIMIHEDCLHKKLMKLKSERALESFRSINERAVQSE